MPIDLLVAVIYSFTVGISGGLNSPDPVCLNDGADAFVEMALATDLPSSQLPVAYAQ